MRRVGIHARVLLPLALLALLPTAAHAKDAFPETGPEALAYYEADPDHWLDGPVQYIILDAERERFEALKTRTERERFIRRFWERRDPDLRDRKNPFRDAFYERVAEANERYHEYPRGWMSDRGMLRIVLGKPDHIRVIRGGTGDAQVWTYYTVGPRGNDRPLGSRFGELQIVLVSRSTRNRYEILGDFGPGVYPRYVREMLEYAKLAAVDPSLRKVVIE